MSSDLPALPESVREGKIFVAGHKGMVGSAVYRHLQAAGCKRLLARSRGDLDLVNQAAVLEFFAAERPDYVILAAAKVGGIHANNTYPAQFIYDNLMISANVIQAAYRSEVRRLLFLGSSCIYPRSAEQPMREEALLTGTLEPTNEPYALAKIAGIKLCESFNREYGTDFRSLMPTNLYGPNDNYDLQNSHVLPALIRKCHEAKVTGADAVEVWGTGQPRREFLHVDDLASATLFVLGIESEVYAANTQPMLSHLNVGAGVDLSIRELAETVKSVVGFAGDLVFNTDHPDGTPRKLLDVSRLKAMGWQPSIGLRQGIEATYADFCRSFH